jgi:hypothetical protein
MSSMGSFLPYFCLGYKDAKAAGLIFFCDYVLYYSHENGI